MIPLSLAPEPDYFDDEIRQRGKPYADAGEGDLPEYWRDCLIDLWNAYGRICCYLCVYIPPAVGGRSVEHFAPKSKHRTLTYEWSNYRLCSTRMNSRKREFEDVLDPIEMQKPYFELNLLSMEIRPANGLDDNERLAALDTIKRLKLNDQECRTAREADYNEFLANQTTFEFLERRSPFVALEHARQTP